jgi:NADP-dependent 3-hydroxy acid dehydrogenase YdfG
MMEIRSFQNNVIWIIGASSGIGRSLAKELASRGAQIAASARSETKLAALKQEIGAACQNFPLDVTDSALTLRTAQAIYAAYGKIDRVIILSASYMPMKLTALDLVATKQMLDINILGTIHVLHAVLPILQQQSGQIALCGSVAGYIGLPGGQPYSATKAAIINLSESLHAECRKEIDIKLISPGFVSTPLTDKNNFNMPMIISAEAAANAIACGLQSSCFEIHFPKLFTLSLKALALLPYYLALRITRKL